MELLPSTFHAALISRLGVDHTVSAEIVDPAIPLVAGPDADEVLWNFFNNIPPVSLDGKYIGSGGAQFFSGYSALLSALRSTSNAFEKVLGSEKFAEWKAYLKTLSSTVPVTQLPEVYKAWASMQSSLKMAAEAASILATDLLNPILRAQLTLLTYEPFGRKEVAWIPGYEALVAQLASAPELSFTFDSATQGPAAPSASAGSSAAGSLALWQGGHGTPASETFAQNRVIVETSFEHLTSFSAVPNGWYDSAAMSIAYHDKNAPPWDANSYIDWDDVFDPAHGDLARFAVTLIAVSSLDIRTKSMASFTASDQQDIRENAGQGLWPLYLKDSDGLNSDVRFTETGALRMRTRSTSETPIVLAVLVAPVSSYVSHAARGAQLLYDAALKAIASSF